MDFLIERLRSLCDEEYKRFNSRLVPEVAPERIIGVRTPTLRAIARQMIKDGTARTFVSFLPHRYFEEMQLHVFIINEVEDFDLALSLTEQALPHVDNWASCDQLRPRAFANEKKRLLPCIYRWLESSHTHTVRFAIEMLMCHFLDSDFDLKFLDTVASVHSEEYYVNMMIAWYFATALAKQYDAAIRYIEEKRLPATCHNKAIQKARESLRIGEEKKKYLASLKI